MKQVEENYINKSQKTAINAGSLLCVCGNGFIFIQIV